MDENDYFWRVVNTPLYWQSAARELICAANLLKRNHDSSPRWGVYDGTPSAAVVLRDANTTLRPIIVLYALAIENMVKAIIVASGQDPIGPKGRIEGWFATHDLASLTKRAKLKGLDADLLNHLTQFILSGKYPTGLEDGFGLPYGAALTAAETLLPILEHELGATNSKRDKLPKADLLKICCDG